MTRAAAVAVVVAASLTLAACGDGTPGFCGPLAEVADMESLSTALDSGDLVAAAAEAQRLRDLADEAPTAIRADLTALAESVVDIVDLLEHEDGSSTTGDGEAPGPGAAEVERRREDLNARFGDLDRRATRVSTWAARECGLDLG